VLNGSVDSAALCSGRQIVGRPHDFQPHPWDDGYAALMTSR